MNFDAQQLIDEVTTELKLSDFGSAPLLEPLELLVSALNTEANLNDFGQLRAHLLIKSSLSNRLQIENYVSQHPDVLQQEVKQPVFIVGLPRTGTTALSHMLNHDPANHTLRTWEGRHPVPPPEEASYLTDPRITSAREEIALTESFLPGFFATHLLAADEPDECYMLFNHNLMSVEFSAMFHIPSYANWLYAQDLSALYAYHKRQLQLLQYKKGGTWVLKAPFHQLGLEAILTTYPDAIIVQTHRAPMSFVASGCSFSELLRTSCSDASDSQTVGKDWMDMLRVYSQTFEAARARLEPQHRNQFLDIYHDEFVKNPWPSIEKIYAIANRKLDADARSGMQAWLDDHPKGKHGKHEYTLEKYGITQNEVEAVFADYANRYNLTLS